MRMMFMPTYWMLIQVAPLNCWTAMAIAQLAGQQSLTQLPLMLTIISSLWPAVLIMILLEVSQQRHHQAIHQCLEQ